MPGTWMLTVIISHKEETSREASLDVWLMWRDDERKAGGSNDPADVSLLGTDGVVFEADGVANLVEQFLGSCFHRFPPLGFDFFRRSLYNLSRSHLPEKGLDRDIIQKTSRNATLEAI